MSVELRDETEHGEGSGTRWEGYADYQVVSRQVASSIDRAIEAFARVEGAHIEDAPLDKTTAAEARGRIRAATIKLIPEMRADRKEVDTFDEILSRWHGEDGLLAAFRDARLRRECPAELHQLVIDIKTAGWELGYLKAGQTASNDEHDPVEKQSESIFN